MFNLVAGRRREDWTRELGVDTPFLRVLVVTACGLDSKDRGSDWSATQAAEPDGTVTSGRSGRPPRPGSPRPAWIRTLPASSGLQLPGGARPCSVPHSPAQQVQPYGSSLPGSNFPKSHWFGERSGLPCRKREYREVLHSLDSSLLWG